MDSDVPTMDSCPNGKQHACGKKTETAVIAMG